jgi:HYR domain
VSHVRPRRRLVALAAAVAALTASTAASADNIQDNVDSSGVITVAPGGTVAVSWRVHETANDGCSAATGEPSVVSVNPSDPVTASQASLTFTSCESWQSIAFTVPVDAAAGDYPVTVSVSDGDGDPLVGARSITIRVTAPPAPPPPDTVPPVVTPPADQVLEATSSNGAIQSFTGTAVDAVDGSLSAPCAPTMFPLGQTLATCTAIDSAGNSGTATFTVLVRDSTGPMLSLPSPIATDATSAVGATVSYSASANDVVDGAVSVSCAPASGSTFTLGVTTVNCSAIDSRGNASAGSFTVTVRDEAPTITVPGTQAVEALDATGARVNFVPQPTATDALDGPVVPSCAPASGSQFPIGTSTVTCSATDSSGASSKASFEVVVRDTTPPLVTPPLDVVVVTDAPLSQADPRVARFLSSASAADLVGVVRLESNAPPVLPLGTSTITFTAADAAGNVGAAQATIELRPPVAGSPQPPALPPVVRTPPANVADLRARQLDRSVRLEWRAAPTASRYVVTRFDRTGATRSVYDGRGVWFVDRGLVNGEEYRYVVVSYDASGLRSVGVAIVAVPRRQILLSPKHGAGVSRPPLLKWRRLSGATYYNLQVFRVSLQGARTKVLSTWPLRTQFLLNRSWRYGGRVQHLATGTYEWYVWAGFGPRTAENYSPLLGWSRFNLMPRTR